MSQFFLCLVVLLTVLVGCSQEKNEGSARVQDSNLNVTNEDFFGESGAYLGMWKGQGIREESGQKQRIHLIVGVLKFFDGFLVSFSVNGHPSGQIGGKISGNDLLDDSREKKVGRIGQRAFELSVKTNKMLGVLPITEMHVMRGKLLPSKELQFFLQSSDIKGEVTLTGTLESD